MDHSTKVVAKSEFKPCALELFRLVEVQRETIVITDRGRPVLKIVPFDEKDEPELAALRGSLARYDDPLEPAASGDGEAGR